MSRAGHFRALGFALVAGLGAGAAAEVEFRDGWVRAMPPGQNRTAAYGTLHNAGAVPARVTGAHAGPAGRAELHETLLESGVSRMRPRPSVVLAPGENAVLKPGGLHLMLMDIERMPAIGEAVRVCFEVQGQPPACGDAAVRRGAPAAHRH